MKGTAAEIIGRCQEFERCGPLHASVQRVSGTTVSVVQECINWPENIASKITKDSRTNQLNDLFPLNRDQFGAALSSMVERLAQSEVVDRKPKGPGMG